MKYIGGGLTSCRVFIGKLGLDAKEGVLTIMVLNLSFRNML